MIYWVCYINNSKINDSNYEVSWYGDGFLICINECLYSVKYCLY